MIQTLTVRGAIALLWWQARAGLGELVSGAGQHLERAGRRIGGREVSKLDTSKRRSDG